MNFRSVLYILGRVLNIEGAFMLLPFFIALIYREDVLTAYAFTAALCAVTGFLICLCKPKNMTFYAREGFLATSLSWIVMGIFGCIPFVMTGEIPVFTDALFETISGFTTTGTTILNDIESLSLASLFWRSFTHWLGGMGVLVFLLALLPMTGGSHMNIMRAESPGPSVDKLMPKVRQTAAVLYSIYIALTVFEFIALIIVKMPVFDALNTAVATAGTGGFAVKNDSMASYSPAIQWVVAVFMMLFGVNFGFYFYIIRRRIKGAFSIQEVWHYALIIAAACALILISVSLSGETLADKSFVALPFSDKLRHTFFQVCAIITTTGFTTINFDSAWTEAAKLLLVVLMFVGACAGSTGGGIKISRITILMKTVWKETTLFFHPKRIVIIKNENKPVAHETIRSTNVYIMSYILIFIASVIIVSFDNFDFTTSFTAITTTLNNIGPGLNGAAGNFSAFSHLSKYVIMFDMLAGRLEIYPMMMLFVPELWKSIFKRR